MWKIAGGFTLSAAAEMQQGGDAHPAGFHSPPAHSHGLGFAPHAPPSPMGDDEDHLGVWDGSHSPMAGADGDDHARHGLLPAPVSVSASGVAHGLPRPGPATDATSYLGGHFQSGSAGPGAARGVARAPARAMELTLPRAPKRHLSDADHEDDAFMHARPRLDHHAAHQHLHEAAPPMEPHSLPRFSSDDRVAPSTMAAVTSGYSLPMATAGPTHAGAFSGVAGPGSAFRHGPASAQVPASVPPPAAGSAGAAPGGDGRPHESSGVDVQAILSAGRAGTVPAPAPASSAASAAPAKPTGDGDVPTALMAAAHRLQRRENVDVLDLRGTCAAVPAPRVEEDDEDDEDDDVGAVGSCRRQEARERRRQRKNDRERRRRQEVSDAMDDLAEVARVLTGTQRRNKSDKVTVLQAALRSIRGLTEGLRAVSALARGGCAPVVSGETAGIMTAALSGARR